MRCEWVRVRLTVAGGDSFQDNFSLYNKIGWELIHAGFDEHGPSDWKGCDISEDELNLLIESIQRIKNNHTGLSVARVTFRYIRKGKLFHRDILPNG